MPAGPRYDRARGVPLAGNAEATRSETAASRPMRLDAATSTVLRQTVRSVAECSNWSSA
jgi:hypothetical protein